MITQNPVSVVFQTKIASLRNACLGAQKKTELLSWQFTLFWVMAHYKQRVIDYLEVAVFEKCFQNKNR